MKKVLGAIIIVAVIVAAFFLFFQEAVPPEKKGLLFKEGVLKAEAIVKANGMSFFDFLGPTEEMASIDDLKKVKDELIKLKNSLPSYKQTREVTALNELLDIYIMLDEAYIEDSRLFLEGSDVILGLGAFEEPNQEMLEEACNKLDELKEFNDKDFDARLKYLEVLSKSQKFSEKFSDVEGVNEAVPKIDADFQPNYEDLRSIFYLEQECINAGLGE